MKDSQILNQRPFDLADGDRYLIVMVGEGDHCSVVTRIFESKPITSLEFTDAKTYKSYNTAEKARVELTMNSFEILGKITLKIFQVRNLFEPRYFVQLKRDKYNGAPELRAYPDWYIIGENQPDTYLDYDEALEALDKCKRNLVEFYYSQIINTRDIQLKKM